MQCILSIRLNIDIETCQCTLDLWFEAFIKQCLLKTKAHIPLEWGSRWLPNANEINTKKKEMYMVNARNLHLGPNTTYIPLTQILGLASGVFAFLDTNMLV